MFRHKLQPQISQVSIHDMVTLLACHESQLKTDDKQKLLYVLINVLATRKRHCSFGHLFHITVFMFFQLFLCFAFMMWNFKYNY